MIDIKSWAIKEITFTRLIRSKATTIPSGSAPIRVMMNINADN